MFLISSRYVIMQNLHDGRPRNETRNGTYYCSTKSTGSFEGSRRFKVELLSFYITDAARAHAYAILQGTANEIPTRYPLCSKPQGLSMETSFMTSHFFSVFLFLE